MLHMVSYSPDTILLNEHTTEAAMQDTLSRATEISLSVIYSHIKEVYKT